MKNTMLLSLLLGPFYLAACGGGGGDDSSVLPDRLDGNLERRPGDNILNSYRKITLQTRDNKEIFLADRIEDRIAIDISNFSHGLGQIAGRLSSTDNNGQRIDEDVTIRSYRGHYATIFETSALNRVFPEHRKTMGEKGLFGHAISETRFLPSNGIFTYKGMAFNNNPANDAALNYVINYGTRRGSGEIAAAGTHGKLVLEESPIRFHFNLIGNTSAYGVKDGNVSGVADAAYTLSLAGDNAEEFIGDVHYGGADKSDHVLFMHGTHSQ